MQTELFAANNNLLPFNGEVWYYPTFFTRTESDAYLAQLQTGIAWKQEAIRMFGKAVMQPRLTAWYGDEDKPYSYSGITMQPNNWTAVLSSIKNKIETVAGVAFTSALLNFYRDGQDSMGWHRDNEKELGPNPVIASVSFGATRIFQLRPYKEKKPVRSIELAHGSLLLMRGETQHYWEHRLPKVTTGILQSRINLTFRVIR